MKTIVQNKLFAQACRLAVFIGGLVLLAGTWFFLFIWIAAMTEGTLAPWDVAPGRPPLGTFERSLNDFFEGAPGVYLPAALVIAASACLFIARLTRPDNKTWLPLEFAATNLAFVVAFTILAIPLHYLPNLWLPQPRPAIDAGYHRTWTGILAEAILLLVLLRVQYTGIRPPAVDSLSRQPERPRRWLMAPALMVGGLIFVLPYTAATFGTVTRFILQSFGVTYGWPTALSVLPAIPIYLTALLFQDLERYGLTSAIGIGLTIGALVWARPGRIGCFLLALTLAAILAFPWFFNYQPAVVAAPGRTMHVLTQPGLLEGVAKRSQSIVEVRPCTYTLLGWSNDNALYYQEQCGGAAARTLAFKPGRDTRPWLARTPGLGEPLPELSADSPEASVLELVRAPGTWPPHEEPNVRRVCVRGSGVISSDGRWVALRGICTAPRMCSLWKPRSNNRSALRSPTLTTFKPGTPEWAALRSHDDPAMSSFPLRFIHLCSDPTGDGFTLASVADIGWLHRVGLILSALRRSALDDNQRQVILQSGGGGVLEHLVHDGIGQAGSGLAGDNAAQTIKAQHVALEIARLDDAIGIQQNALTGQKRVRLLDAAQIMLYAQRQAGWDIQVSRLTVLAAQQRRQVTGAGHG